MFSQSWKLASDAKDSLENQDMLWNTYIFFSTEMLINKKAYRMETGSWKMLNTGRITEEDKETS